MMRALLARVTAVVGTVALSAATLAAQAPQTPAAQEGFQPYVPGQGGVEQLPATPLVFSAYAFVWVALVVYVFTMWRRVTRLEAELRSVQQRTGSSHRP